jgi:hypothetical protein
MGLKIFLCNLNATTKVPGHSHQVSIVWFLIGTVVHLSPLPAEATD